MATRVVVVRSGGFAGLVASGQAELDEDAAQRWEQALAASAGDARPRPDGYVYEVSLGPETAVLGEQALSGDLRSLVDELFRR